MVVNKTPEYDSWRSMLKRCTNVGAPDYGRYGGRGITVCGRWRGRGGLANFIADMGLRPSRAHSIDRIDNSRGYEPANCRWATLKQQLENRRCTIRLTINGETKLLKEWCAERGVNYATAWSRYQLGQPPEMVVGGKQHHGNTPAWKFPRQKSGDSK